MCRFTLYMGAPISLSSLLTEPDHSLINQSYDARERSEPLNGDGFGVAWYVDGDEESAIFRSVTPAWNNANLSDLSRVTKSSCILAHVRAATQGLIVSQQNCHPFKSGKISFCHNGDVGGFQHVRRPLTHLLSDEAFAGVKGSTDSEHIFALLLDNLAAAEQQNNSAVESMAAAMQTTVGMIDELIEQYTAGDHSYLNLALSNGIESVVCRYTSDLPEKASSLYINKGRQYICEQGVCQMQDNDDDQAVIVSSEPLSANDDWKAVPVNHMMLIDANLDVETRKMV